MYEPVKTSTSCTIGTMGSGTAGSGQQSATVERDIPEWQIGYHAVEHGGPQQCYGLKAFLLHRLASFRRRLCLDEASGMIGDFGVLIPLLASCAKIGSVRLGPAMFWMGIFNIASAIQWDIPMPVQPMKSIAAVAITEGLSPGAFAAAGIITGSVVWILGVSKTIEAVHERIPSCIISGMQIGLGINMAAKGCSYWHENLWLRTKYADGTTSSVELQYASDGKIVMALTFVATLLMLVRTKLPVALIVFIFGVLLTFIRVVDAEEPLQIGVLQFPCILPTSEEWLRGLLEGAIPQLPLTTMNSVISVCALSVELFRDERDGGKSVSRVSVASSVGLMNVIGCWFGAMPSCHGAGGLAGQFKFGARGGMAILMLGMAKIFLAVVLGQTLDVFINYFPVTVLGVLLLFAGVELATVGAKVIARSPTFEDDMMACFVTAGAYMGTKNMALGVLAGLMAAAVQRTGQQDATSETLSEVVPGATRPVQAASKGAAESVTVQSDDSMDDLKSRRTSKDMRGILGRACCAMRYIFGRSPAGATQL
eukprot:TRINITY_DN103470_c0_g1_i1.p1 TRINITY_DN103470_c0_g1~~TRINITY_DN103470_c0_g1_i1.p1  ORF type:complete len:538 (-),score=30.50 TRINITY_DN103470_c0_g1_i1:132-1745(-)